MLPPTVQKWEGLLLCVKIGNLYVMSNVDIVAATNK